MSLSHKSAAAILAAQTMAIAACMSVAPVFAEVQAEEGSLGTTQRPASSKAQTQAASDPLTATVSRDRYPTPDVELSPEDDTSSAQGKSKLEAIISTSSTPFDRFFKKGNEDFFQGYFDSAEKNFILAIRELKKSSAKDERIIKARNNLGSAYLRDGKLLDAKEAFELAMQSAKEQGKEKSLENARAMTGMAGVHKLNENYKKAEQMLKDALAIRKDAQGENTTAFAQNLLDLGELYRQQKLFPDAEPVYQLALESLNKAPKVPDLTKAYFLDKTGMFFHDQAKMPEAKKCFEMALGIKDKYASLYTPVDARKRGLVHYRAENGIPNAARVFARGVEIEAIHVKDAAAVATLTAQVYGQDWYLLKAEVTIQNQGKTAISACSEPPSLSLETPKRKQLSPLDSAAIAAELGARGRTLYNRLLHSADFAYVVDNVQVGGATTVGLTPFGPSVFNTVGTWTNIRPDWEARAAARNSAMRALSGSLAEGSTVFKTSPVPVTIGPGESATFQVFFPYNKFDTCTLRFLVGNVVLEFPFTYKSG